MSNDKEPVAAPPTKLEEDCTDEEATVTSAGTTPTTLTATDKEGAGDTSSCKGPSSGRSTRRRRRFVLLCTASVLVVLGTLVVGLGYVFCPGKKSSAAAVASASRDSGDPPQQESATLQSALEKVLDFSDCSPGDYVSDELREDFGVTVTAAAASSAAGGKVARIFDTANPGDEETYLGSPHASCGGSGQGWGGRAGRRYQNCRPLGNVLVIDDDKPGVNNCRSGTLTFDFDHPVDMEEVALFNVLYKQPARVQVTDATGMSTERWTPRCVGENGVYYMPLQIVNATRVRISFPVSGAVAHLKYRRT